MYHLLPPSVLFLLSAQSLLNPIRADYSAPTASSQYTSDADFQSAILAAHTFFRDEHNATALNWNDTSASYAAHYVQACQFQHSGGPTGENLAAGYPNASTVVDAWANERASYDFGAAQFTYDTGHFTQVVWKSTTTVGCARTPCEGQNGTPGWYVVCEYHPQGNVIGAFAANVQAQIKGGYKDTVESGVGSARTLRVPWRESIAVLVGAVGVAVVLG